jgi:hypothetical protein
VRNRKRPPTQPEHQTFHLKGRYVNLNAHLLHLLLTMHGDAAAAQLWAWVFCPFNDYRLGSKLRGALLQVKRSREARWPPTHDHDCWAHETVTNLHE